MSEQNKDFTEGKFYKLTYYVYSILLTSVYFIATNILFVLGVIFAVITQREMFFSPVVTLSILFLSAIPIGPAWSAILSVMSTVLKGKIYSVTKDFFKGYRYHFKKSIIMWTVNILLLLISTINYIISINLEAMNILILPTFVLITIGLCMTLYAYPLLVKYSISMKEVFKLSLYFSIKKLNITLLLIVSLLISFYLFTLLPQFLLLVLPGGFGLLSVYLGEKAYGTVQLEENSVNDHT